MSAEKILGDWKKKLFKPVYWLEGDEEYYIDKLVDFAEHNILPEAEASFNLTVFYGKDAAWADVVNACMRYPMFADRQVIILKEAQQMRDIEKLEQYINRPLSSTILVVAHKEKKLDGRSSMAKNLKKTAEVLTTKKLYENQLPEWTNDMVRSKGFSIEPKAAHLLVDHVGNDLSRLDNEIDKILVNLGTRKTVNEDDIERFVGISKEYNAFELQKALAFKDLPKAMRIIQYFESNPKAAPIQLILPTLYNLFSKTMIVFNHMGSDEKSISAAMGVQPFFVKDYLAAAKNYGFEGIERSLILLHHYNLRTVGIHDADTTDASLLKEMVFKMMM
ncbi:MAG TPA: DNA polymerase III subunit delta [Flavitalea sp.]|nr:DNA polymerase III subunit delta [Flavitalea sp.]